MASENCGNCNDKLSKTGDYASCSFCSRGFHFERCSVKKQTWTSMGAKQSTWVCTICRKNKKGSTSQNEDEDVLPQANPDDDLEVSSLGVQRSILAKVTALMDMKGKLDSIESSMKFLAEKYDSLLDEVVELRAENKELKAEVNTLKSNGQASREAVDKVNTKVAELSAEIADLDQYGRRLNLEIHGLKVEGNSAQENLAEVLQKVAKDIHVDYQPSQVHQAHRLQPRKDGNPPAIIVQFYSKTIRDKWLHSGRKARISGVYFNESLSGYHRLLLKDAKLRARTHGYAFVWFSGGRVLVKKGETSQNVLVIKSRDDLKKIN
ncbi:uncharacterized protein LOC124371612 [Homalodisca vitripennis]|uniref:uncharacterized protein LOC124371612 n=1 Tax=Homalodisca vitripennis TaxID=197043 RepID=UPI001EEAA814|nr:uncharacterized protein LOC124371612 [Homalodisca vitripennis]